MFFYYQLGPDWLAAQTAGWSVRVLVARRADVGGAHPGHSKTTKVRCVRTSRSAPRRPREGGTYLPPWPWLHEAQYLAPHCLHERVMLEVEQPNWHCRVEGEG